MAELKTGEVERGRGSLRKGASLPRENELLCSTRFSPQGRKNKHQLRDGRRFKEGIRQKKSERGGVKKSVDGRKKATKSLEKRDAFRVKSSIEESSDSFQSW